jgi:hypothetical protein
LRPDFRRLLLDRQLRLVRILRWFRRSGGAGVGSIWALGLLVGYQASAQPAQHITLPPARDFDARKGLIDGRAAVGLWPSTTSDIKGRPADPSGFEAHIALREALDSETVHPAGEWFFPWTSGVFLIWLESPARSLISPSPTPLIYHFPAPAAEHGLAFVGRIVPAGRVRLDAPACGGDCVLGLLHANSHIGTDGGLRPEMKRLVAERGAVEHGALMPVGTVAATLYDKRLKEYRAIDAPIAIASGQTAVLHLKPPGPGLSDLVVVLIRPKAIRKATAEDAIPRLLLASGQSPPPAFAVSGPKRLYAIWKGVAAGKATLLVESKTLRLPQPEVVLRPGRVESVEAALVPLPRLGVRLDLPEELRSRPLRVSVESMRAPLTAVTRDVAAHAERTEFQNVPAVPLRVAVVAGPWELDDNIDLSDGKDAEVTLRAQLTTLEGTVYYGRDPRRGRLTFRTNHGDDEVSVETDAKGRYRIVLARPSAYMVMVQFPDRGRPYLTVIDVPTSGHQDLRVPGNDFRIRVVRSDSGAPIPKADVSLTNTSVDEVTQGFSLKTGDDGVAHVMPLRPGVVDIGASAPHFGTADFKDKVPEGDFSREITLSLKPLEEGTPVALVLPSGQPALGAELWVQSDPTTPAAVLSADEAGRVSLPDSAAGLPLLVRAPGAASGFVLWDGQSESIALGPAGPPLTIAARKENGDPAAWARLALWIGGARYNGNMLRWAFSAQPSDRNGLTTLQSLPPGPLAVLVWSPDSRVSGLVEAGAFDARQTMVAFPWANVVTVTTVD